MSRRTRRQFLAAAGSAAAARLVLSRASGAGDQGRRPNILFAISDDQTWLHTGAAGEPVVKTPAFDRVAREGILFRHAYCAAPSCSPSRAGILTGQHIWRLEEAGNIFGPLKPKFRVYPDRLEAAGYHVGYTGKGWAPGSVARCGRKRNPAGPAYRKKKGHVRNFEAFLDSVPGGKPFCFWFGSPDPHRGFPKGAGRKAGMTLDDVRVPPQWPDTPAVRGDIADYLFEIQRFDRELGAMLERLEQRGLLDHSLVVVTSDNGMDFPRAKTTLYDFGTRMPLAVRWPEAIRGGRVVDDFVSLIDFAPTFLEAAGLEPPPEMTGRSLMPVLASPKSGRVDPARDRVFAARERHSIYRKGNVGYPMRALRTHRFLYIRNFAPDRWPAGDPPHFADPSAESPAKQWILAHRDTEQGRRLFGLCYGKRPAEELYDLAKDPWQLRNVAEEPAYAEPRARLGKELMACLRETGDPRGSGRPGVWDTMPIYRGRIKYPGYAPRGT